MSDKLDKELMKIYTLMLTANGHRNWWPAENDFEMIVGAILTQFVTWNNVSQAINALKSRNSLSVEGILMLNEDDLEQMIRCTRFYKQKTKKLKMFCKHLSDCYQGDLNKFLNKKLNILRDELLNLYGVGEETADCIILYAARKPIFVVDAYTKRVFSRLRYFGEDVKYKDMQEFFMKNLEDDVELYNDYHAQIVFVGNNFCFNKKPNCEKCPLVGVCKYKEGAKIG